MTNSWQDIIKQQADLLTNNGSTSENQYIPLPQLSVLNISGSEAGSFLQNLLTNDVNALLINQSQLSGFCNAKGRLFSVFRLIRRESSYQIILPQTMGTLLKQRLSMFILRSKVSITDISDSVHCIAFLPANTTAISTLEIAAEDITQYDLNDTQVHFAVIPDSHIDEVLNILQSQDWQLRPESFWELREMNAGLPTIQPETKEKFTPQQVNLDLVSGVSFNKGCYPGQEVVARLHYLGKPSRRMFLAEAAIDNLPLAGEEIATKTGDVAGHIVRVDRNTPNTVQLLLSLKLSEKDAPLFLNDSVEINLLSH